MRQISSRKRSVIDIALLVLIMYIFWGFVFTQTIFQSSVVVYLIYTSLLIMFAFCLVYGSKKIAIDSTVALWCPFIVYTCIGYFMLGDLETFSYWIIALLLLLLSSKYKVGYRVPWKAVYYTGIIMMIGIGVQILFKGFYDNHVAPLFLDSEYIFYWERTYGYAGFTYQLDSTAIPILYAEGVFFFLLNGKNEKYSIKTIGLLLVFILFVFLTGKRMLSLLAVIIPFFVYLCSQRSISKRLGVTIIGLVIMICSLFYVSTHTDQLLSSTILRRLAQTLINLKLGQDISTGRTQLYEIAINAFKTHPLFGIGIGNFTRQLGAYTATHNTYLQILCEQGLFGFLLFITPLIVCLYRTIVLLHRCNSGHKSLLQLSLFCQALYILYSFSGNTNINLFGYIMYFLSITICVNCKKSMSVNCR